MEGWRKRLPLFISIYTMFWRKKDKTPKNPFEEDASSQYSQSTQSTNPPSYVSTPEPTSAQSYNEDSYSSGGRYGSGKNQDNREDSYSSGGRYGSRKQDNYEENARNDLFSGAPQNKRYDSYNEEDDAYGSSRFGQQQEEDDQEQEISGLKSQIRNVKQESLASTRNALQKIYETEQSAANTMNLLGQQSTQIANVDRNLDLSKAYSDRAASQASELKQLNRSIFIPVVSNPFTRSSRERKELEARKQDHAEHMNEREEIRQFEYESQARVESAQRAAQRGQGSNGGYRRGRSEEDKKRYQFEADEEDDDLEDELDSNLDLLGDATARLKNMALSMNTELDSQNKQLGRLTSKVDPLSEKLVMTTHKLNSTK
ncbi:hypothetical protein CLU79DRAFT_756919 [Phycomyces nitens]|nr:hypothetical protein CLU79DRAFT_756919 [Phycomyces nitens]